VRSIIKISSVVKLAKTLNKFHKKIVLVGGCFDLVHLGHLIFLKKAKSVGDILIILLESDQNIKKLKGDSRPINSQINRAKFLNHLKPVDFIVLLPEMKIDHDYQDLIAQIKPAIIAVTKNDPKIDLKNFEAKSINAKVLTVTNIIPQKSTSLIVKNLNSL
jgi:FAD synthetase